MIETSFILSVLPFLLFIYLLLWKEATLLNSSVVMLSLFTVLSVFYWQIVPDFFYLSLGKGFFVAFDIFIIIFGAVFFLKLLKELNIINNISCYLQSFSKDYRVQVIVLAWFFENFLEGTAGFGTPVAIVAPLLIGIGLSPIKSLVVSLLGNSAAGVFGAAGTPIRVGFAGLDVSSVPLTASILNCVGFIVPIFMLWIITEGRENRKKEFFEFLPFAILSGLAFVIPSIPLVFIGQEFPTIIGAIIGLIIILIAVKIKFLIPKDIKTLKEENIFKPNMSASLSYLPYGILVFSLIAGKIILGTKSISIPLISNFSHSFALFNPGFAFIISGLMVSIIYKTGKNKLISSLKNALFEALHPFVVIISLSAFVQLMINSGQNISGIPAAVNVFTKIFETNLLPLFAPFVSAFGSFLTGSITVSNIMFGKFFSMAATSLNMDTGKILALGLVGAAAANMIALADMLAAEAVVGVKNKEKEILKGVFIPCLIYVLTVGIIGMFII